MEYFKNGNAACCSFGAPKKKLRDFSDLPCVLALEPVVGQSDTSEDSEVHSKRSVNITKKEDPSYTGFKNLSKENYRVIFPNKITYDKKVFIVYNPNSGRKINIREKLDISLKKIKIEFEIYETVGYLDAFNKVKNLDIDLYSAILVSGGDGTIHECVNGMLMRPDSK